MPKSRKKQQKPTPLGIMGDILQKVAGAAPELINNVSASMKSRSDLERERMAFALFAARYAHIGDANPAMARYAFDAADVFLEERKRQLREKDPLGSPDIGSGPQVPPMK